MEEVFVENAKVSDSGYSNTCSNSQSQRSLAENDSASARCVTPEACGKIARDQVDSSKILSKTMTYLRHV
ncbi:hypothetical protein DBV15_07968 [Temnothorax longispinosus]|uniref:Uncharacterized protein n=1 Tax=Temnothorax longispinosus TaxID=300112 RepID=A0A4S2K7L1_9HYME|nr:hypothetical protein DBV15_07968 [Temnothorax longispinosus]